jgi:diadenosine tetraphosphatase ApaH/serine/threonine PP2A family protein phosphatase
MEFQAQLVVRKCGKYLLLEDEETHVLHFPQLSCNELMKNDVIMLGQAIAEEILHVGIKLKGVLKVIHQMSPPLVTVVLVAEAIRSDTAIGQWIGTNDNVIIDNNSKGFMSQLDSNCTIHPLSIIDTMDKYGVRKIRGLQERQMIEESFYGEYELDQIAEEFTRICGSPSAMMDFNSFCLLMEKYDLSKEQCTNYFKAMKSDSSASCLTLEEVMLGICALDPATPHGSTPGQIRCQFIFRYYTSSGQSYMTFNEFRDMFRDICIQKRFPTAGPPFEGSVSENWNNFGVTEANGLSLSKFLTLVGQLKFRGTSVLFRLPRSPVDRSSDPYSNPNRPSCPSPCPSPLLVRLSKEPTQNALSDSSDDEQMEITQPNSNKGNSTTLQLVDNESLNSNDSDMTPNSDGFIIATHSVKVRRSGMMVDVISLWDLVNTEAVVGSVHDIGSKPSLDRLSSIKAFNKTSKSNEMLSGLRYFEHGLRNDGRGKPKNTFSWGAIDMNSVARCFLSICAAAADVFANEERLLQISSPCYVLGDLHGNFHDLICFEKVLWRMGAILTPASFVFLGDYVDRGEHGFEVIAYLLAQKVLMPSKFLLIRGNHEIRSVQESFTYKTECYNKFGEALGHEIWEATNVAFDAMPIAGVIDSKIFCVHGGIPHPMHGDGLISTINDIPSHLPNPMEDCPLAWEIMWNDPVKRIEEDDLSLVEELQTNDGFIENYSRGTAYMFSSEALDNFLTKNNLSHVIRAHEVKEAGFQLQHNGRLLTVFSSSHYQGSTNEAACVLVDDKKIRTIRLDTLTQ